MGAATAGVRRVSQDFYRAFEEKHRGSRDFIKHRLEVYLPFLANLRDLIGCNKALDLGCGRGEWLELLQEQGYQAVGVDIDDSMLEACRERGLEVKTYDAITYLEGLPDESLAVVSAFHLVEHIPFDALQVLVAEAKRVLQPGGLLILETPNPENLAVGACHFYLDPTHQRPIPPDLLIFTTEYAAFYRSKILRLQETKSLMLEEAPNLMSVLAGASPDYAVVAQKNGSEKAIEGLQAAFDLDFGLSLDTLAARFQNHLVNLQAQTQLAHAEAQATHAEAQAAHAEAQAESRATTARLFAHIESLENRIENILSSQSWRITAPLRWISTQVRLVKSEGIVARFRALASKIMRKLRALLRNQRARQPRAVIKHEASNLTPQARQVYDDLNETVSSSKKD